MFIQSNSEISYTSDRWRAAASGSLFVFCAVPFLAPVALSFYFDGLRAFNSPAGLLLLFAVFLVIGGAFAVLAVQMGFRRISQPDRMTISIEGLTYSRFGAAQYYPWSRLGDLVYMGGRGSGSYRMDIAGERKPIRIVPKIFGSYDMEFKEVITAARQGRLISVTEMHAKLVKEERQLVMFCLPLMGILIATILFIGHKAPNRVSTNSYHSGQP